jgi:hypothetical protein
MKQLNRAARAPGPAPSSPKHLGVSLQWAAHSRTETAWRVSQSPRPPAEQV